VFLVIDRLRDDFQKEPLLEQRPIPLRSTTPHIFPKLTNCEREVLDLIAQSHNHAVLTEQLTLSPTTGSAGCTEAAGPTWLESWPDFSPCSWAGFVKLYRFTRLKFHCFNPLIDFQFNQAYSESSQGWDTRHRVRPSPTPNAAQTIKSKCPSAAQRDERCGICQAGGLHENISCSFIVGVVAAVDHDTDDCK
jgi:hypothetical protein